MRIHLPQRGAPLHGLQCVQVFGEPVCCQAARGGADFEAVGCAVLGVTLFAIRRYIVLTETPVSFANCVTGVDAVVSRFGDTVVSRVTCLGERLVTLS